MTDKEIIRAYIESQIALLEKNDTGNPVFGVSAGVVMAELKHLLSFIDNLQEEPVSNDLEEACDEYYNETWDEHGGKAMVVDGCHDIWFPSQATDDFFKAGAQWQKENLWKDAQGDDLPGIDREVIVLVKSLPEHEDSLLKVAFAHRPPEYWEGKNICTGKITRYEPKRYDKGDWNQPNVVYWLDVELPKEEE